MSTQDPRGESQSPEELLAETQSVLGDEDPATGNTREVAPTQQVDPTQQVAPTQQTDTAQQTDPTQRQEPTPADKDADLAQLKGGAGMSAGMWASLILGAVIVVLLLIFILQNNGPADFQYFGWQFQLPLGIAMLFAAIGGIFIAGIIGSVRIFVLNRKLKKISKALGR